MTSGALDTLASAIAGRQVHVAWARRGSSSGTDGRSVLLGRDVRDPGLIRLEVTAQALLIALDIPASATAEGLRGETGRRYAALELSRLACPPTPGARRLHRACPELANLPSAHSREHAIEIARDARTSFEVPALVGTTRWWERAIPDGRTKAAPPPTGDQGSGGLGIGVLAKLATRLLGGASYSVSSAAVDGVSGVTSRSADRRGQEAGKTVVAVASPERVAQSARRDGVLLLPEWDARARRLRPDRCAVHLVPAPVTEDRPAPAPAPRDVARLRRALAPIALGVGHRPRDVTGHELDLDAVVRREVDRRAGRQDSASEHIRRSVQRMRPQLSVLALLDRSGSSNAPDYAETNGTLVDDEQQALSTLLAACDATGVESSAFAFRTYGRSQVEITPLKEHSQHFGPEVRRTLTSLPPGGFTRLGAAIRFAVVRSRTRNTGRQAIVLFSDGYPFDDGYELSAAVEDVRAASAEAAAAGNPLLWARPADPEPLARRCLGDRPQTLVRDFTSRPIAVADSLMHTIVGQERTAAT